MDWPSKNATRTICTYDGSDDCLPRTSDTDQTASSRLHRITDTVTNGRHGNRSGTSSSPPCSIGLAFGVPRSKNRAIRLSDGIESFNCSVKHQANERSAPVSTLHEHQPVATSSISLFVIYLFSLHADVYNKILDSSRPHCTSLVYIIHVNTYRSTTLPFSSFFSRAIVVSNLRWYANSNGVLYIEHPLVSSPFIGNRQIISSIG